MIVFGHSLSQSMSAFTLTSRKLCQNGNERISYFTSLSANGGGSALLAILINNGVGSFGWLNPLTFPQYCSQLPVLFPFL